MNDRSVHIFDIYEHPEAGLRAVRRGFSWEAFLLPAFWAVRRGLGWTTMILFVLTTTVFDIAGFAASLGFGSLEQIIFTVAGIALLGIKPGFDGYRWQGEALVREGYARVDTEAAATRRHALEATRNNRVGGAMIRVAAG